MASPFQRSLPARPDLAQQKTQARELLEAFGRDDVDAIARIRDKLPDKPRISLADSQYVIARENGFESWPRLRLHIETVRADQRTPIERAHDAFARRDSTALRRLLTQHAEFRQLINAPVMAFNSPPIVACANDVGMVDVLLEFGANPNAKSEWWAGGFHPLHSATGTAAERLIAAGATIDACAAAHLDRRDELVRLIAADPQCVHERGGDGQTPLHFARSIETVDILLAAGADLNARDVDHRSSAAEWMLECAGGRGRYALSRHLVERGAAADIFLCAALGLTTRAHDLVASDPSLLDLRTGQGAYGERPPSSFHIYQWTIGANRSPLDVAAQFGHEETVAALLPFATPNQQFVFAAARRDESTARALLATHPALLASLAPGQQRALSDAAWNADVESVRLMLALGFDPRVRGHDSGTALHCAAWQGSAATVAALLEHRDAADLLTIADAHYGATPLGWCCHGSLNGNRTRDHAGVARLLLAAGAQIGADTTDASDAVLGVLSVLSRT
jgi:ankyrin repeat protein